MNIDRNKAIQAVRVVMERLVAKDYESLRGQEESSSLSPEYIREAIEEYGETLVIPPNQTFECLDFNEFDVPGDTLWWSQIDLYTAESVRSSLTMEIEIMAGSMNNHEYYVIIKELHVM